MEEDRVQDVLKRAAEAVADLPEGLKPKAFELAVGMLTGAEPHHALGPTARAAPTRADARAPHDETADVADLLRAAKRNPDRYLVFAQDLEGAGEPATTAAYLERFRTYKQDAPKLPSRDLGDMVAKSLLEQVGKGRDATYILKRKGRERLAQLAAGVGVE